MGIGDWIVLGILAVLLFFAVRYAIRHRGSCGNCQNCAGCMKQCKKRKLSDEET